MLLWPDTTAGRCLINAPNQFAAAESIVPGEGKIAAQSSSLFNRIPRLKTVDHSQMQQQRMIPSPMNVQGTVLAHSLGAQDTPRMSIGPESSLLDAKLCIRRSQRLLAL